MKQKVSRCLSGALWLCVFLLGNIIQAQLEPGIYMARETKDERVIHHKLAVSDTYLIHTAYEPAPAKFLYTRGGFYTLSADQIDVRLEFNSEYEANGETSLTLPISITEGKIAMGGPGLEYAHSDPSEQELDGAWLFATRGPDSGQERRDDSNSRKTLKFLMDGSFQWIAYNTESFKFFGSGGGSYSASEGVYTENIEFFSRDDSRVGAELQFNYEIQGDDWHHKGKNSRGEPMYEIWSRR